MTANQLAKIEAHGNNLLAIFPQSTEKDPVKLCKKLRRLENIAGHGALAYCNGAKYHHAGKVYQFSSGGDEWEKFSDIIAGKVNAILGNQSGSVPVFINADCRGYALKIESEWVTANSFHVDASNRHTNGSGSRAVSRLYRDFGGFGIIAPEITE